MLSIVVIAITNANLYYLKRVFLSLKFKGIFSNAKFSAKIENILVCIKCVENGQTDKNAG
jgi:hypothetical protein